MRWLLAVVFLFCMGGCREDNDSVVVKKRYVTVVNPPPNEVMVEVNCTCLCHDDESNDGHDDHFVPPGHRR